jgi:hypothetical protein
MDNGHKTTPKLKLIAKDLIVNDNENLAEVRNIF